LLETVEPAIVAMEEAPEVAKAHRDWAESRRAFNADLKVEGTEARSRKWQKDYFQGAAPFGIAPGDHRTKLRLREFSASASEETPE
jgi:hypothetical protein